MRDEFSSLVLDANNENYPDSEGRDSSQMRRPWVSMAKPSKRLLEPDTTSAVMGDFHEPYGAVSLSFSPPVCSAEAFEAMLYPRSVSCELPLLLLGAVQYG